jgi:hypothetical protein
MNISVAIEEFQKKIPHTVTLIAVSKTKANKRGLCSRAT